MQLTTELLRALEGTVSGTAWKEVDNRRVNYHFVPYVLRKISEIREEKQGM